jgi:hypothetical protein
MRRSECRTVVWPRSSKKRPAIGNFTYTPLVMKIRGAAQTGSQLPVLSSIDGIPVLDLRYLVADYRKKTSKIDEQGSRRILASATAAVSEMLSRFDFESDDELESELKALRRRDHSTSPVAPTRVSRHILCLSRSDGSVRPNARHCADRGRLGP